MVIAFAGRRMDALNAAEIRFPANNIARVSEQIRSVLKSLHVRVFVSSAACGADILALEAAGLQDIRRRIILPFNPAEFRESSVTDRPGDWGARFDAIVDSVKQQHDLVQLEYKRGDRNAYPAANHVILAEAISLASQAGEEVQALAAWDGKSRGEGDLTESFLTEARRLSLKITAIPTV